MGLPREFQEQFNSKGENFSRIAETLYENHGDQFTLSELADEVELSESRVSSHLGDIRDKGENDWVHKHSGDTTFVWNTEKYNPAEVETTDAVFGLYTDLWAVVKTHWESSTSGPAIFGLLFFVAAFINWFFYIAFSIGLFQESAIQVDIYFWFGFALIISGVLMTLLSPLMAIANRTGLWIYGQLDD